MGLNRRKNMCVTYQAPTGLSGSGDRQFLDRVRVLVWHEKGRSVIRSPSGRETVVNDKLLSDSAIPQGSKVWLQGDNVEKEAPFRAQAPQRGETFRGQEVFETWL